MLVAGIDIGSTTTKVVLMKDKSLVASSLTQTGADIEKACKTVLDQALESIGRQREDISYIVTTGYGRRGISYGNECITEISANAKGSYFLNKNVRTIIDVGGQDTKAISLDDNGIIKKFVMNDKCAAGTGRFFEVMARALDENIDNFSRLSLDSQNPATVNSTCTVFAESEVISLIAQKVKKEDIIAGLHKSIAKRVSEMAKKVGIRNTIMFDGGGAKNIGFKKQMEDYLGFELFVPEIPQYVVALGAAIIASEKVKSD